MKKRRTPEVDAERDAMVGALLLNARHAVRMFDAGLWKWRPCAKSASVRGVRLTAKDTLV